jgi:NADH dehydrogenase
LQRLFPVLLLPMPEARFQPLFVEDLAAVCVASLRRLESFGHAYELGGPKVYTLRDLVLYVGMLTGHRRPVIGLGHRLSYLQALAMELLPGKLMTRDNVESMKVDSVAESGLPFGVIPTALEAVAPEWLAQRTPRGRYRLFRDRSHHSAAARGAGES